MPMPGLLPVLLASSHLMLAADRVPDFNVTPSCRASTQASGMANRDESSCKKDEASARDKLTQDWAQYSSAQKAECVRLTTLGGPPSYVELITCLEMSKAASSLPADLDNSGPGSGR
jgi:hypothetical protein